MKLSRIAAERLKEAVLDDRNVIGLTHNFYRYPARFSPTFARAAIESFTERGDLIFDPFVGGGTSLVEALAVGRRAIGVDINSLATFVTEVKITPLTESDVRRIQQWLTKLPNSLNLHQSINDRDDDAAYKRNIDGQQTWPIRKTIALALDQLDELPNIRQQRFIRCGLLRTAQWALDSRKEIPTITEFRKKIFRDMDEMLIGMSAYSSVLAETGNDPASSDIEKVKVLNRSIIGIEHCVELKSQLPPKLILTSPPYPGVHVLYHRWQVQGRRETPAPYWIANKLDGSGASYYTFGDRKEAGLFTYYQQLLYAFSSLAKIANQETLLVQLVAFSDRSWQLPLYLEMMQQAGFVEHAVPQTTNSKDGRLWRAVPNRKWYATQKGAIHASREVVLFHKLIR